MKPVAGGSWRLLCATRNRISGWLVVPVLLSLAGCQPDVSLRPRQPQGPPNILLISIDTLRADHLSSHGYRRPTSPFMDDLATQGTRFTHCFVNTHGTPPSHTTMFTSLPQETHRVSWIAPGSGKRNDVAPQELLTLAEVLAGGGYRTVAVTGGGFMGRKFGLSQGFDHFKDKSKGIESQAESLLGELASSDAPIFAFLHTYEVHSPYVSPDPYQALFGHYDSEFVPINKNLIPIQGNATEVLTPEDMSSIAAAYDRGIRYTDDVLRRTFKRLEASGFLENTYVLLTSDHGEEFGEHGGVLHPATLYDELLHVPLILVGPSVPVGVSDPRMVSTLDIAPTILSLAGLAVPDSMRGRNLLNPELRWDEEDAVFSQYGGIRYSMRTPRWKLIQRTNGKARLFDLQYDPRETRDVAEEFPAVLETMAAQLESWRTTQPSLGTISRTEAALDHEEEERLKALGYL